MGLISVEISDSSIKGAVFKKKNGTLDIIDYNIKKTGKYYISIFYQDFIYATVVLPPVKDEDTLHFLIKNRLSDKLEPETDYIFLPTKNKVLSENQVEYTVYAIPEDLFYDAVKKLNITNLSDVEVFTLSQFALSGITSRISEDQTVFMTYTDDEKFIITVSKGGRVLYTRSTVIPEFITEEQQLVNFYYENFNLTYIYVVQNQGIDIDSVGLVGKISKVEQFVELIFSFSQKPVYTVLPELFLKESDFDRFCDYIIPIGTINLEDNFNFLPSQIKHTKTFSLLTKNISFVLVTILILFVAYNIDRYTVLMEKYRSLERSYLQLKQDFQNEILSKNISPEQIQYLTGYINLLSPEKTVIYTLNQIADVLYLIKNENINISYQDRKKFISIRSEQKFSSITEMENFKKLLNSKLQKLKEYRINNRTVYDIDKLECKIHLELIEE
ncbi:hypothetical protein [Persephonella sp.]